MQVGCGVFEHTVRGRRYLYFWHYETRSGRRCQVTEYVGPAGSRRVRAEAIRRCEAYYTRAVRDLNRARPALVSSLA